MPILYTMALISVGEEEMGKKRHGERRYGEEEGWGIKKGEEIIDGEEEMAKKME